LFWSRILPPSCSGDVKMPISERRVNDFPRETFGASL
jgi:hypothetical protein